MFKKKQPKSGKSYINRAKKRSIYNKNHKLLPKKEFLPPFQQKNPYLCNS